MSTSVTGKVQNDHGVGLPNLLIQALESNGLHGDVQLGIGLTDGGGFFSVPFTTIVHASTIRVRVYDPVQRLLAELDVPESTAVNLVANFSIPSAVVDGLPVAAESGELRYLTMGN